MDYYVMGVDMLVELTNTYNKCDLDYYMQAFAPILTSLSGFLSFGTSLISIVISDGEVYVYEGLSSAAYNQDPGNAGKFAGLWCKHLFGVDLQDATVATEATVYGTTANGGV